MNDLKVKVLDIGCGKQKVSGAIGVDFNKNLRLYPMCTDFAAHVGRKA